MDLNADQLLDALAECLGERILTVLEKRRPKTDDPLLTVKEIAARLRIGETSVRQIINSGALKRAKGISDMRVRESVVNAYGK